jgi:hypothetical protein
MAGPASDAIASRPVWAAGIGMVHIATVRRIAGDLPQLEDASDERSLTFRVAGKGLAWTYMERVAPKKPREPRLEILAVRCRLETKEILIAAASDRFFDDDHYRGYPAVLVRLDAVGEDELRSLLADAWALVAPKAVLKRHASPPHA